MRALPKISEPRRLPPLAVERAQLANGLEILVLERRGVPVVDLQFVVRRGADVDAPARAGRVSMTAEMIDEGTHSRGALDIAEQLDYLGAHLHVEANWDAMTASLHVLSPRLEPAVEVLADVICHAAFPEQEFRRKRDERLGALQQEEDEAALVAAKALAHGVFGDAHPYGAPLAGTCATIEALTSRDVATVYGEAVRAPNAFVLAVGDVDAGRFINMIETHLNALSASEPPAAAPLPAVPASPRRILLVDKPGAAQAELRIGHAAPARSTDDFFPLLVMNTMLGGSFTSRLNMILRERMGVTYGARSRFVFRRRGGIFSAGAAVFTEAAARSAEVVIEEIERMASERVPNEELRRAQSYIALGLPRQFETTEDIAAHLREQVLHELADDYWQKYVDRVLAVSADDVREVAARHLHSDASTVVVVADRQQVERALERTKLAKVVTVDVKT